MGRGRGGGVALAPWAQLAPQHLGGGRRVQSRSLVFALFIASLKASHLPRISPPFLFLPAPLSSRRYAPLALLHLQLRQEIVFYFFPPPQPPHSLTVLVLHCPRAKHISSTGHSEDQWRGKARRRLKIKEGRGCNKREDWADSANTHVCSEKSAKRLFICTRKAGPVNCGAAVV